MIHTKIQTIDRMVEIISSMRDPQVQFIKHDDRRTGKIDINIKAVNRYGIVMYTCDASTYENSSGPDLSAIEKLMTMPTAYFSTHFDVYGDRHE